MVMFCLWSSGMALGRHVVPAARMWQQARVLNIWDLFTLMVCIALELDGRYMTRHDPAAKRHGHVKVSSLAIATEAIVGSSILCLPVLFQQEKIRQNAEQITGFHLQRNSKWAQMQYFLVDDLHQSKVESMNCAKPPEAVCESSKSEKMLETVIQSEHNNFRTTSTDREACSPWDFGTRSVTKTTFSWRARRV